MRLLAILWLLIAALISALCSAGDAPAELSAEQERRLKGLIAELASEDQDARDKAERLLKGADVAALPLFYTELDKLDAVESRERLARAVSALAWRSLRTLPNDPVTFDFKNKPLKDAAHTFGPLLPTFKGLYPRLTLDPTPITFAAKEMPAPAALRWLARLAHHRPPTPAYFSESYEAAGTGYTNDELAKLIREEFFAPNFAAEQSAIRVLEKDLRITNTFYVHESIRSLIALLKAPCEPTGSVLSGEGVWRKKAKEQLLAAKKVSINFKDAPLNEAIAHLQKFTDATLIVDPDIRAEDRPKVTLKLDDVSFHAALSWTVSIAKLWTSMSDHAVIIGNSEPETECRVFDVRDLEKPPGSEIIPDLRAHVEKFGFFWVDPLQSRVLDQHGGRLLLRHDHDHLDRIGSSLAGLRGFVDEVRKVEPDGKPPAKPLDPALVPGHSKRDVEVEEPWKKKLREKLEKEISFDFEDKPLTDVLEFIRDKTGVNMVIDRGIVADGDDKAAISLRVTDMRASLALKWVLRLAELEHEMVKEVVFVTKKPNLATIVEIRFFYVRDLLSVIPDKDFAELIKEILTPSKWGDPTVSIESVNGILDVMQDPYTLTLVEPLLDYFRLHYNDPYFVPDHALPYLISREHELREKLKQKIKIDFKNTSVADVFLFFREHSGISCELDPDIKPETLPAVTLKADDIEIQAGLEKISQQLKLEFILWEGRYYAGSRRFLNEQQIECRIYNLSDLNDAQIEALKDEQIRKIPAQKDRFDQRQVRVAGKRLILTQTLEVHSALIKSLETVRKKKKE